MASYQCQAELLNLLEQLLEPFVAGDPCLYLHDQILGDVHRAGSIPGVPTDPTGTPYELSQYGRVQLSRKSPLFPLPQEPQRLAS